MAAAGVILLIWMVWLTVSLSEMKQKPQASSVQDPSETAYVSNTIQGYTTDLTETAEKVMSKLVTVSVVSEQSEQTYSGVIYSVMGTDTWILTTAKAAAEEAELFVRFDNGLTTAAQLQGSDALTDICLLKTHPDFPAEPVEAGSSAALKHAEYIIAMGGRNLHTQSGDCSFGIVSRAGQKYRSLAEAEQEWIVEFVSTDAVVSPVMDGGILVNLSGQMVGMLSGNVSEKNGMAAAVGMSELSLACDEIRRSQEVTRGYLGVITKDVRELELYQKSAMNLPLDLNYGLVVMEVLDRSPAQEAGIQPNDVIQSADDVLMSAPDALRKVLYSHEGGDLIELDVIRGDMTAQMTVTLR